MQIAQAAAGITPWPSILSHWPGNGNYGKWQTIRHTKYLGYCSKSQLRWRRYLTPPPPGVNLIYNFLCFPLFFRIPACSMANVQIAVFLCFVIVLLAVCVQSSQSGTQAPLCQPGILEEMPQHIKKVCLALENSDQLTSALKSYINNEASGKA